MPRRLAEFIELREEDVHEICHPVIALGILRPIEADEQHAGLNRIDRFPGLEHVGIFVTRKRRRQVQVLQPAIIGDRHQVQPAVVVFDRAQEPRLARARAVVRTAERDPDPVAAGSTCRSLFQRGASLPSSPGSLAMLATMRRDSSCARPMEKPRPNTRDLAGAKLAWFPAPEGALIFRPNAQRESTRPPPSTLILDLAVELAARLCSELR
jgi:hypothetical protein